MKMDKKMNMQDEETRAQASGCFNFFDLILFIYGAFIMFGKTANLFGKFAPDDWFGLSPVTYGIAAAVLIEGYLVMQKVKAWILPPRNFLQWATGLVVTLIPFALSLTAQVIDSWFTTGLIQAMSQEDKMLYTNITAALVGIPLLLAIIQMGIDTAPPGVFDNIKSQKGDMLSWFGGWFRRNGSKEASINAPQGENSDNGQAELEARPRRSK
jgi:hypothetical protein